MQSTYNACCCCFFVVEANSERFYEFDNKYLCKDKDARIQINILLDKVFFQLTIRYLLYVSFMSNACLTLCSCQSNKS